MLGAVLWKKVCLSACPRDRREHVMALYALSRFHACMSPGRTSFARRYGWEPVRQSLSSTEDVKKGGQKAVSWPTI